MDSSGNFPNDFVIWDQKIVGGEDSTLATSPMSSSQQPFVKRSPKCHTDKGTRTELCGDNMCKRVEGQRCWYCSRNREGVSTIKTSKYRIMIWILLVIYPSLNGQEMLKYRPNGFETLILFANSNSWNTLTIMTMTCVLNYRGRRVEIWISFWVATMAYLPHVAFVQLLSLTLSVVSLLKTFCLYLWNQARKIPYF